MKLSLYYPVKPEIIGQKFGETANLAYYKANGVIFKGHNGIDFAAIHGQPIYAAHDGVAYYEVDADQGHGVILITNQQFDYGTGQAWFKSIYWHMCDSSKEPAYKSPVEPYTDLSKPGLPVKAGDLLGYADSTGLSTGDHLHFGLKPMNFNSPNEYTNIEQDNGYYGAVNPEPYFNGLYAQDINAPTKYIFNTDMKFGDSNESVRQLQLRLQTMGYFPREQQCTGLYGGITRAAVFAFQEDYIPNLSWFARIIARGLYCYSQTRNALNNT